MEIGFTMTVRCNIQLPDELEIPEGWSRDAGVYGAWEEKVKAWLEEDLDYALDEAHYKEYGLREIVLT